MNNYVMISGTVSGNKILATRTSGAQDTITLDTELPNGRPICVVGELHSENNDGHVYHHVHVQGMFNYEGPINRAELCGYVCKTPVYRKTPAGKEITDIMIATSRADGHSNYIPLIAWGSVARKAASLKIGDKITAKGRVQSRTYEKGGETRMVNEVTVDNFKVEY